MKYRKLGLFLALASLLCGCGKAEPPENPYRLKQQTVERYSSEAVQLVRSDYTYDENGYVIEIQTYYDEAWHSTRQYSHDAYGNILTTRETYADGTENVHEETLTLDDQHRVIRSESISNDGRKAMTEYSYNADGQITRHNIYRYGIMDGTDINSFTDYTYDRKGNLVRQDVRWEPNSGSDGYILCTYRNNRLVRDETYQGEQLTSYTEYTYDETGLIRTAVSYDADGTPDTKHITTSDEYGNTLEVVAHAYHQDRLIHGEANENPDSRTTYVYEPKN